MENQAFIFDLYPFLEIDALMADTEALQAATLAHGAEDWADFPAFAEGAPLVH